MSSAKNKRFDRRGALAKIHISRKYLGLKDEEYREILLECSGKDSCSRMTDDELKRVLNHMSRFIPEGEQQKNSSDSGDLGRDQNLRIVYAKARRLLGEDWKKRLVGLTERIAGKSLPEWCTNKELRAVMSAVGKIGRGENKPK